MSVKKTGSPFSSGADPIDQAGSNDPLSRSGKVESDFKAALADAAADLEQTGGTAATESKLQSEFRRIAGNTNFDSPEGEAAAIRESAHLLVNSRLGKTFEDSTQGKQLAEKLSTYIANDPFLQRKLRDILHQFE